MYTIYYARYKGRAYMYKYIYHVAFYFIPFNARIGTSIMKKWSLRIEIVGEEYNYIYIIGDIEYINLSS